MRASPVCISTDAAALQLQHSRPRLSLVQRHHSLQKTAGFLETQRNVRVRLYSHMLNLYIKASHSSSKYLYSQPSLELSCWEGLIWCEIMAEIVGIVASAWTLVSIARAATKFSKSLLRAADAAGSAGKEIETFALDIQAFASIIRIAHKSLDQYYSNEPDSPVLKYIEEEAVLDQLVAQSQRVIKNIREVRPKIKSVASSIDLMSRLRWLLQRSEVQALGPRMECVKSNLHLIMSIIILESAKQNEQSPETQREMSVQTPFLITRQSLTETI